MRWHTAYTTCLAGKEFHLRRGHDMCGRIRKHTAAQTTLNICVGVSFWRLVWYR